MGLKELVSACDFVTDVQVAVGGDRVRCALSFLEASGTLTVTPAALELVAEVPHKGAALDLLPQKGIKGAISAIGEAELDDKAIDDAWVVRGDPGLLVVIREELRALAEISPSAPAIRLDGGSLTVTFAKLDPDDPNNLDNARAAVLGALALWHRIAFHM